MRSTRRSTAPTPRSSKSIRTCTRAVEAEKGQARRLEKGNKEDRETNRQRDRKLGTDGVRACRGEWSVCAYTRNKLRETYPAPHATTTACRCCYHPTPLSYAYLLSSPPISYDYLLRIRPTFTSLLTLRRADQVQEPAARPRGAAGQGGEPERDAGGGGGGCEPGGRECVCRPAAEQVGPGRAQRLPGRAEQARGAHAVRLRRER
eukprot:3925671-Rhodomonas_salina.2